MNIDELQKLFTIDNKKDELITLEHLDNQEERTLLYGYDCDRNTWHTYIKDNEIKTVIYDSSDRIGQCKVSRNEYYIPNKRLYPEACDYEFCKILKLKDIYLPFTGMSKREYKKYYGKVL